MIILGVDPGYAIVGYGIVRAERGRFQSLEHGAITTRWLPKCRYRIYKQPCCKVLYFLDLTLIPLQKFWYQYLSSHLASP